MVLKMGWRQVGPVVLRNGHQARGGAKIQPASSPPRPDRRGRLRRLRRCIEVTQPSSVESQR